MYRIYYAERDTTLYEKFPEQNTGIDQILELTKIASGSKLNGIIQSKTFNSRILIDFGSELTKLSSSIHSGEIPRIGNHKLSSSVFLSLKASDASDLLQSYTIEAYPVSESWENGNGFFSDDPINRVGASWFHRSGDASLGSARDWDTGSAHSSNELGATETFGGGTWVTGSGFEASQSFQNESPDIKMNVSDIVQKMFNGSVTNNGFIIKRRHSDEIDDEVRGNLKFFGRESHTIFVPKLEVCYDDSDLSGNVSIISSDTYVPYFKNIKAEYRRSEIAKFRVGVRPEFPNKSFVTESFFLTGERLPLSSSYSIIDSVTNETIIPFTEINEEFVNSKTKISSDDLGSYFKLRMDSFMPERYYKIMLKMIRNDKGDTQTFDDFYFKVVN